MLLQYLLTCTGTCTPEFLEATNSYSCHAAAVSIMQVCFPQTPPHPTTHTPFPSHDVARGALPQVTQCKIYDPVCSHPPVNSDFFCARIDGGSQGRDARCQLPLLGLQSSLSVQMDEQNALIFLGLETRSMRRMVSFAHAEISLATKKKK